MHFADMKKLAYVPIAPGRLFGAWVCLVAAVLLWSPAWAAAWQMRGMTCCTGTICLAHGHAGTKGASKSQSTAQEDAPMECNHGSQTGLMACQMSCCHDHDHPLTGSVIFVLPEPMTISVPMEVTTAELKTQAPAITHLFEPPSPPPRSHTPIA
jgi:hypothetical protein